MDEKYIGNKLKHLRQSNNMRQSDLAEALSVSMSTISHWEKGRRFPSVIEIKRIADFFGVDVNVLLNPNYDDLSKDTPPDKSYSAEFYVPRKTFGLEIYLGIALACIAFLWSSVLFDRLTGFAIYVLSFITLIVLFIVYTYYDHQQKKHSTEKVSFSVKDSMIYHHRNTEQVIARRRLVFIFLSLLSLVTLFLFFVLYVGLLLSMDKFIISPFVMSTIGVTATGVRAFLYHHRSMRTSFDMTVSPVEMNKTIKKSTHKVVLMIDILCIASLLLFLLIYDIGLEKPLAFFMVVFGYLTLALDLIAIYFYHVFLSGFELLNRNTNKPISIRSEKEESV